MNNSDKLPSLRDVALSARSLEIVEEDGRVLRCDMGLVERMAAQGMTVGQIAALLGVSRGELRTRKAMADQLMDAVERGKSIGIGKVSEKLLEQAAGGNTIAAIFYLKAVAGWREADKRPPDDIDGSGSGVKIYLPEKDVDQDD